MAKEIETKQIGRNITLSLVAQMISLIVLCIVYLVVPKVISEINYAYWQIFVLYANYVYLANLGILDGLLLRYSSYDVDELDKPMMRGQFRALLLLNCVISLLMVVIALLVPGTVSKTILILLAFVLISRNLFAYSSYSFQITNRISQYALIVIVQRVSFGLLFISFMVMHIDNYVYYCVAEILGDIIGFTVGVAYDRQMYAGKSAGIRKTWDELKENISAGIMILMATLASSFLIGGARIVVQWGWEPLVFGKVSLAVSISNMFLMVVSAVSIALFPSLKRIDSDRLPYIYDSVRTALSYVMFVILLFYFPAAFILRLWLPAYAISMEYLGIILPYIVFSSRINMLTINYLKVYRMERFVFVVNTSTIVMALGIFSYFAFVVCNLAGLLITLVAVVLLQSIMLETKVMHSIKLDFSKDIVIEIIVTVVFIVCTHFLGLLQGFLVYLIIIIVYSLLYYKEVKALLKRISEKNRSK